MDIKKIQAGYVPWGKVLVHRTERPIYEYDPHWLNPGGSDYISYYSAFDTSVYSAGRLAPIEYFETGVLLDDGETTWGEDEYDGPITIRNDGGNAVFE